jgi:hypothetical protein
MKEKRIECTEISATWCPICGDCCCSEENFHTDDACPLHARTSPHGLLSYPEIEIVSTIWGDFPVGGEG